MARFLFIVARGNRSLCEHLKQEFGAEEDVEVILDRRRGERRQRIQAREPERRRAQRRHRPVNEDDLRTYGFVAIREQ